MSSHSNTASHPASKWFFPGYAPGRHINPAQLLERLHPLFSPRAGRLGTLHELTKLAPVAIIAEALGYTAQTIERHAKGAATTYAEYVASPTAGPRGHTCGKAAPPTVVLPATGEDHMR